MKRTRTGPVFLLLLLLPATAITLPWDKDMRDQPSVKPQESKVETNPASVPIARDEPISPPENINELVKARLQAGAMKSPVPMTGASVNRGKILYDIQCAVCHGEHGYGDGPVGRKFIPDPMNLTLDYVQTQPDGQLFYTISHGSIAMPAYRDSIVVQDRWHLINYIKAVFGEKPE